MLEDVRYDVEDAIDQAQKTTLHVFVVVLENLVEFVEELDFSLHHYHPPEVKFEEQEEGQDAFASDHDVLVLEKLDECRQELLLFL